MKRIIRVVVLSLIFSLSSNFSAGALEAVKDSGNKYIKTVKDKDGKIYKTRSRKERARKAENLRLKNLAECEAKKERHKNVDCSQYEKKVDEMKEKNETGSD